MVPQTHVPVPRPSTLQTRVEIRVAERVRMGWTMVGMESKDGGIAPELGRFAVTLTSRPFINCQHQRTPQPSPPNRRRMLAC